MNYINLISKYSKMKLFYTIRVMCLRENQIKFHYVQNFGCLAAIVYDDGSICNSKKVLYSYVMTISMDTIHVMR